MSALASTVEPQRRGPSGLAAAFLVALGLHIAALVGLALFGAAPTAPPGENVVTIDLAPQMTEADTQSPSEQAASAPAPPETKPVDLPETVPETKPLETAEVTPPEATAPPPPDAAPVAAEATTMAEPPEAPTTPPVETVSEPPPEDQVITSTAESAPPLAPPPPVVAQVPEPPKPVEAAKPKPDQTKIIEARREAKRKADREARLKAEQEERREAAQDARREAKAKAAKEAARRAPAAASEGRAAQNSASASRQSSAGAAAGGNDPNALRAWQGALSSAIRGRMNANAAAGTSGGVAVVRFTVSRSGQVMSSGLASSSGVGAIDSAAMATVRGSLPAAPAGVSLSSLAVTVPLRFSPGR
ncbi:TonB family protein [Methylobacterium sp. BTF04]|uniref:energy transducer TonB family protein n=1 Tax=Methylobacterium sp. BTF04 TaxID=2708300 RepID=UPI0013D01BA9|nr:energy transducer TonB [Methylobacterium sp. BTF04]NEU12957.1 TonB family protein [Methylobacterium sp. BTF04]